jgi:hypothetical protein
MSGGIFPGKPFKFNIKCIIFTLVIACGYWFLPKKNIWILLFLLWFPYIALAWYDYSYNCQDKLLPTAVPFGRYIWLPFKPPGYQAEFKKFSQEQIAFMDKVDHITGWSILIVGISYGIYYLSLRNKK